MDTGFFYISESFKNVCKDSKSEKDIAIFEWEIYWKFSFLINKDYLVCENYDYDK